jgi:hypothetical protein
LELGLRRLNARYGTVLIRGHVELRVMGRHKLLVGTRLDLGIQPRVELAGLHVGELRRGFIDAQITSHER